MIPVFGVVFPVSGIAFHLGVVPFHMGYPDCLSWRSDRGDNLHRECAQKLASQAQSSSGCSLVDLIVVSKDWQMMLLIPSVLSMAVGNFGCDRAD